MEEQVSLPYASIKSAFYAVLRESLEECLRDLEDLSESERGRYERRLKELCSAIFEDFCRKTTLQRSIYQPRKEELLSCDGLFPTSQPADPSFTEQRDLLTASVSGILTGALDKNKQATEEALSHLVPADRTWDAREDIEPPDLRKTMEAHIRVLRFERDQKEKSLDLLRQSQGVPRPKTQDPSLVEAQVARFLDQGF